MVDMDHETTSPDAPASQATIGTDVWLAAFMQAPVPLAVLDLHGRFITSNPAGAEFLGFDLDDNPNLDLSHVTQTDDEEWSAGYFTKLVAGQLDSYVTEKTYVRQDGSKVSAKLTAWPVRIHGRIVAVLTILEPVQPRELVSNRRLQLLLENIGSTVSLVDAEGRIIETSGRYQPVLGYPPEFWATRSIFDLLVADDAERVLEMREAVLSRPGSTVKGEFEVSAADGSIEAISVHAVNLLDDPGVRGIVVTTNNVTEQAELRNELARRRDEAVSEVERRSRAVAIVSHELRNPMHAMQGMAELLELQQLPDEAAAMAQSLRRQLGAFTHLLDDLLISAQLEEGTVTLNQTLVEVNRLVEEVCELGRGGVEDRPITLSAQIDPAVPAWVVVDERRLRQVLTNLVGNAVKFTNQGSVQLSVQALGGRDLTIEIVDTGRGIPVDELTSVMNPLATGSNSATSAGAGLGLSIVRRLVSLMGGTISLASAPEGGVRATVVLPVMPAEAPSHAPLGPGSLVEGLRVLVVEDNLVNQQLAVGQLDRLQATATVVGSGEEALDLLMTPAQAPFDLALMDYQLPGIDGLETTRRLRLREAAGDSGRAARLPVIGVTASASAADRVACLSAGMDDFIAKPVSLAALRNAITRVLSDSPRVGGERDTAADDGSRGAGQQSPIDETVLAVLADELGDSEIVAQLVTTFLSELATRVAAMIAATEIGDEVGARRAAHTLKSSARLLGGARLADACESVEHGTGEVTVVVTAAESTGAHLRGWLDREQNDYRRDTT